MSWAFRSVYSLTRLHWCRLVCIFFAHDTLAWLVAPGQVLSPVFCVGSPAVKVEICLLRCALTASVFIPCHTIMPERDIPLLLTAYRQTLAQPVMAVAYKRRRRYRQYVEKSVTLCPHEKADYAYSPRSINNRVRSARAAGLLPSLRRLAVLTAFSSAGLVCGQTPAAMVAASAQWQDPETGLIWMRCSLGQQWDGVSCKGEALALSWHDAKDYIASYVNDRLPAGANSQWRLPTVKELSSIRKCTKGWRYKTKLVVTDKLTEEGRLAHVESHRAGLDTVNLPDETTGKTRETARWCEQGSQEPTVDTQFFPNTPKKGFYWSSTRGTGFSNGVWGMSVGNGSLFWYGRNYRNLVRLVRSAGG